MRRTVSLLALVLAAAALAAIASLAASPAADGIPRGRILILDSGRDQWPQGFEALSSARGVSSLDALDSSLTDDIDVVVLAPGVAGSLRDDELAGVADRGIVIMGIETPLAEVWRVSGALSVLRGVNPGFAEDEVARSSCEGCSRFYSFNWHSCPADPQTRGGSGQGQLAHTRFAVVLDHALELGSQCPR